MRAYERFISYVKTHTASVDDLSVTPSTQCQFDLSRAIAEEMKAIGMEGAYVDEHAYVYGFIPATPGYEDKPCIAFNAHVDTIPDFPGNNVQPRLIENFDGGDIALGTSGRVISAKDFPELPSLKGQTVICTDGTTVLGADDKAGIAEIMTACERVIAENIPHGRISVCFSPDEEIGHGGDLMDLSRVNADFGYTVDGGDIDEINCETFNASAAVFEIEGFSVHPGSAKNVMRNASLIAMEINAMLPAGDTPAHTEDYEGFFHLHEMEGGVTNAKLVYIVRDHDAQKFANREDMLRHIEKLINEKYGEGTAKLYIREQYRNMYEQVQKRPEVIALAEAAVKEMGMTPKFVPIRGGTDGAHLSERGLVCPNLGTGGFGFHGPYEHITVERLDQATELLLTIIKLNIKK